MHVQPFCRSLLTCVYLAFLSIPLTAQSQLTFEHISVENGLSQATANHIMQDSQGFLWVCTQDGFNRYDGYDFRIYRNTPGDSTSLTSNFVWKSLEDHEGNIWVATFGGGLCKLNRNTDQFRNYQPNPLKPTRSVAHSGVRGLYEYPAGTLWIGTDYGLSILDMETDSIISFRPDQEGTYFSPIKNLFSFYPLDSTHMLLGGNTGLWLFNTIDYSFTEIPLASIPGVRSGTSTVSHLLPDSKQEGFWVGTSAGLTYIQFRPHSFT